MNRFDVRVNNYRAEVKWLRFPGGEHHVVIKNPTTCTHSCQVDIKAAIENGEIMELALLKDAIDRLIPNSEVNLTIPYFPYARQDRVANRGEALSVAVFAKLINSMGFNKVIINDPHSEVTPALIDKVEVIPQHCTVSGHALANFDLIAIPDAGAAKKIVGYYDNTIQCLKTRNTKTGALSNPIVTEPERVKGKSVLIIDDICDGGYTFIQLAKLLKELGATKVGLYVTHGIFSKGIAALEEHLDFVDSVFTFNTYKD